MLNLASSEGGIPPLKEFGLGMLLIAGFEINVSSLRSRQAIALIGQSGVLGMAGAAGYHSVVLARDENTHIAVGVALSSTAAADCRRC